MSDSLSKYNFEKVPLWNPDDTEESFEILSDPINGRIPVTRIEHWRNFTDLLDHSFFNRQSVQFVFRGHRRYDWKLTPTLGRLAPNEIVTQDLADQQLKLFKKAIRGRVTDYTLFDEQSEAAELWSIGQHHGLMTPLLDWTHSPYVALFFAFVKPNVVVDDEGVIYRAVYFLNKTFISDNDLCPEITMFEPTKDDHGRLVAQDGLFTFSPYDSTIENKLYEILGDDDFKDDELRTASESQQASILAKYMCKVLIKDVEQQECLKHLRRMNVHHASLFPDVLGAADYCNVFMAEKEREKQNAIVTSQETVTPIVSSSKDAIYQEHEQSIVAISTVSDLLKVPNESNALTSSTIDLIANEITKVLAKCQIIDWEERDNVQAEMKNKTRILLRKYGYPREAREYITNHILSVVPKSKGNSNNE